MYFSIAQRIFDESLAEFYVHMSSPKLKLVSAVATTHTHMHTYVHTHIVTDQTLREYYFTSVSKIGGFQYR